MSVVLKVFEAVGKPMRMEGISELGESTLLKLKEAIRQGNTELATALADYVHQEIKVLHDVFTDWLYADLAYVAKYYGEEAVPKMMRFVREVHDKVGRKRYSVQNVSDITNVLDKVRLHAQHWRGHSSGPRELGEVKIWEEPDRYVMEADPCGSGGRMARGPLDGTGSRAEPPFRLGKTTKPYPWSWGKAGVPYYCTHCCLWREVMDIERQGYPSRINEFPVDDFSKPCRWIFYKDPNLIPEEYFERVGFKKDPSKFKRAPC